MKHCSMRHLTIGLPVVGVALLLMAAVTQVIPSRAGERPGHGRQMQLAQQQFQAADLHGSWQVEASGGPRSYRYELEIGPGNPLTLRASNWSNGRRPTSFQDVEFDGQVLTFKDVWDLSGCGQPRTRTMRYRLVVQSDSAMTGNAEGDKPGCKATPNQIRDRVSVTR